MNLRHRYLLVSSVTTVLSLNFPRYVLSQVPQQPEPGTVIRVSTSLVLVDVTTQNPRDGLPLNSLRKEDFRVLDNGVPVEIATFDSGAHFGTRPVALWLVVICNEQNKKGGSSSFLGKETSFRPPLNDINERDKIGVAHWCDNGDVRLDVLPMRDKDIPVTILGKLVKPIPFIAPPGTRVGELAFQRLIRSIIQDAHRKNPQPLPVVVLLDADYTGMSSSELQMLIDDFLETSGILFGIKDSAIPPMDPLMNGQTDSIFHYMADQTGGQYFSVTPDLYGTALEDIIAQMHFRYQLGFKPPVLDGKKHRLTVELVGGARKENKAFRLRYRPAYIAAKNEPEWVQ